MASFKVDKLIAVQFKPHTLAELIFFPTCCDIVRLMFGDKRKNEIINFLHSNDTDDFENTDTDELFK